MKIKTVRHNMVFNPLKPVYLMCTEDVTEDERIIAIESIEEILNMAGVKRKIPIKNFGVWKHKHYKDSDGGLLPHMSVDWYIDNCMNPERGQVNLDSAMIKLCIDSWNDRQPHYDIILTAQDLYMKDTDFVLGTAYEKRGAIVSINRFRHLDKEQYETKKQLIYHEAGHVFGLPDRRREHDIEYNLGIHCTNSCAMQQGLYIRDWINFVNKRNETGRIYCDSCINDLQNYFNS